MAGKATKQVTINEKLFDGIDRDVKSKTLTATRYFWDDRIAELGLWVNPKSGTRTFVLQFQAGGASAL
jgi:hypothetical protein